MRICRFDDYRVGLVNGDIVADVTDITALLPAARWPLKPGDIFVSNLGTLRPALEGAADGATKTSLSEIVPQCPVANPGKLIGIISNYTEAETNRSGESSADRQSGTGYYLRGADSLAGAGDSARIIASDSGRYGIELAVIIGKGGRNIALSDAPSHIAGYTIALNRIGTSIADSGTVLGPLMVTADEFGDPEGTALRLACNDEAQQETGMDRMIRSVPNLVVDISNRFHLDPGDVILTGTPAGAPSLSPGDRIVCQIGYISTLRVTVGSR